MAKKLIIKEKEKLFDLMKKEKDAATYNKLLILSKIAEGLSVEATSKLLNTHWYTVYRLASRWNKGGYEKIKVGAPKIWNAEKLSELIKVEKDGMVKQRLLVLKMISEGRTVKEVLETFKVAFSNVYSWIREWNSKGYDGIKRKPHYIKKSRMSDAEVEKLKKYLDTDGVTLKEVTEFIKNEFGIEYTKSHVSRILKKMKVHHAKPYVYDKRRPGNAEEIMKDNLEEASEKLKKKGSNPKKL